MKLAWITDIHLNFLDIKSREKFYLKIIKTQCDAVIISGDIAEANSLQEILQEMNNNIKKPIYFILGNHDYYLGQVDIVRNNIRKLMESEKLLYWLPESGPTVLSDDTVLLGQDGWADGRYGDYANSSVRLNDSRLIDDLFQRKIAGKFPLLEKMQQLADEDAEQLKNNLTTAVHIHQLRRIIVLTHVPPFKEACLYKGHMTDDEFLPFFSSKVIGDILIKFAERHSNIEFLVLCGHTHDQAYYQPLNNLIIKVGGAEYYQPKIQEIISITKNISPD